MVSISALGGATLLIGLALAGAGAVLGWYAGITRNMAAWTWTRRIALAFGLLMIGANFLMIYALLARDFTVSYVAEVGSVATPTYFTIISLWASLDGSILLWAGVLGIYVSVLAVFLGDKHREYMPYTLAVLLSVCVFFGLLVAGVSNPFAATDPAELASMCQIYGCNNGIPVDGPGPNPLLQNHWLMAIHPPSLYAGYVGMVVPFSMCAAALLAGRLEAGWIGPLRNWFLIPWAFLTFGKVLGGWWSYAVLGWGGYWAWDPVENASFMPWLVGTAFLHSAMLMQRRGQLKTWTLLLGMSTFILTMFGTFLTRSGVFNSVHAFADGPVGPAFLAFIFISSVFTIALIALREHTLHDRLSRPQPARREVPDPGSAVLKGVAWVILLAPPTIVITAGVVVGAGMLLAGFGLPVGLARIFLLTPLLLVFVTRVRFLSRDFAILLQNLAFTAFTFVVFLGTIYPLLAESLRDRKVTVGEPYFDAFALPIGVTIVWLMAVGPMLPWGGSTVSNAFRKMVPGLGVAGFGTLACITISWLLGNVDVSASAEWLGIAGTGLAAWVLIVWERLWTWLAIWVCLFAATVNLAEYIEPVWVRMRSRNEGIGTAVANTWRRGRRRFGGHIAHLGVVMAVMAIALSKGFAVERDYVFNKGEQVEFHGYELTFMGAERVDETFRIAHIATFQVHQDGQLLRDMHPRVHFYKTRREPLPSPDIWTGPVADLYLSALEVDPTDQFATLRAIWEPGVAWLWFSPLIIFLGTLIAVWPRRRTVRATVPEGATEAA